MRRPPDLSRNLSVASVIRVRRSAFSFYRSVPRQEFSWHIEFTELSDTVKKGTSQIRYAAGTGSDSVMTKIDNDHMKAQVIGHDLDGNPTEVDITFTRKK